MSISIHRFLGPNLIITKGTTKNMAHLCYYHNPTVREKSSNESFDQRMSRLSLLEGDQPSELAAFPADFKGELLS